MRKKIIIASIIIFLIVIIFFIGKISSESKIKNIEEYLLYGEEIKSYSVQSITVYDEFVSQSIVEISNEEDIKEFIDLLLQLKIKFTENSQNENNTLYTINILPIRSENGIQYIDSYFISISENRVYFNNPYGYSAIFGENTLYNYIQSHIKQKETVD